MDHLCYDCSSSTIDGETKVTLWRDGVAIEIQGVPAKICPHCGEATIPIDIAEALDRLADAVIAHRQELDHIVVKAVETAQHSPPPVKLGQSPLRGVAVTWSPVR